MNIEIKIDKYVRLIILYGKLIGFLTKEFDVLKKHPSYSAWRKFQKKYASDKRNFIWFQSANNIADCAFGTHPDFGCYFVSEVNSGKDRVSSLQLTNRKGVEGFQKVNTPGDMIFSILDHILVPCRNDVTCLPTNKNMADFNLKSWFIFSTDILLQGFVAPHAKMHGMVEGKIEAGSHEDLTSKVNLEYMKGMCSLILELLADFFTHGGAEINSSVRKEYSKWVGMESLDEVTELILEYNELLGLLED